jgi:methionine sulfoxide reductase heme-binding subunit
MPPRRPPLPWLPPAILTASLLPALELVWRAARGALGPDAIAVALDQLGRAGVTLLLASLACTPLKQLLGWTWPMRLRRLLGLAAFGYLSAHLVVYVVLDRQLDAAVLLADVTQRPFLTVGALALALLVPLAATSTTASVRRLGHPRWAALHRLVYPAAVLGVVHAAWAVKQLTVRQWVYAAVLAVLLGVRAPSWWRKARTRRSPGGGRGARTPSV